MKITDYIREWRERLKAGHVLTDNAQLFCDMQIGGMQFARLLFFNIVDILTDIINDVDFTYSGSKQSLFRSFVVFVDVHGQQVLDTLYYQGYAVLAIEDDYIYMLSSDEYSVCYTNKDVIVEPNKRDLRYYVMRSQTFATLGQSDYQVLHPYLKYADNILNGSNTANERMGVLMAVSPESVSGLPSVPTLTKTEQENFEQKLGGNDTKYGILKRQKSVILFPRPMRFQTISLSTIDNRLSERLRLCVLAITDRIRVPANQIAMIDSNSSKSLANGTELREGDKAKYKSFRRLLNATFWTFGVRELGLVGLDYIISGEPREEASI